MSPTRVDFYLLETNETDAVWKLACRLLEKAYNQGHRVYVHCDNQADCLLLDELLWTFKDDSFIPHHLKGEGPEPPAPIQIGYDSDPRGFNDILFNMSTQIPTFAGKFRRVIEIVTTDETHKELSRQHYREYRKKGYELNTHTIQNV